MGAPRVDFYLLGETEPRARARFACRLAEKAFALGHRVHLHCKDEAEVEALDQLLWTFRDRAFLPHGRAGSGEPIEVGCSAPAAPAPVLINLSDEVPEFYAGFERVAEIVAGSDETKHASRARFRFYRDRGCTLETHELGAER